MSKLKLINIIKSYKISNISIQALKNISLEFEESGFVSVLGPSGCGKTTLLNIIGGLDHYDSGDLLINDLSTKKFKSADWDAYRNRTVGFIFQNYNLITHQSVQQNVEVALALSGISIAERRQRAREALRSVDLIDQMKKKPSQMSGGQMQRVAIARALINNPSIILADEPTGALDSHTSIQIMDILKEISKTRLIVMVTHNKELADKYSDRIIHLLDGEVQSDTDCPEKIQSDREQIDVGKIVAEKQKLNIKKTSMSLFTAIALSFKNLLTKRGRTIITSFAGSIGIVGVALVLALSTGLSNYISTMQSQTLAGYPISINTTEQGVDFGNRNTTNNNANSEFQEFPNSDVLYSYDSSATTTNHTNILTADYLSYIAKLETSNPNTVSAISYVKGVNINLLSEGEDTVVKYDTSSHANMLEAIQRNSSQYWQEMPNNASFITSSYDLIGAGSRLPSTKSEVAIVVDEYNRLDESFFQKLGISTKTSQYKLTDFIGKTILKVILNNNFYTRGPNDLFAPIPTSEYNNLYNGSNGLKLTITGVLRIKKDAPSNFLSQGIVYTSDLTDYVINDSQNSDIAIAQKNSDRDVILNVPFSSDADKNQRLVSLGAVTTPTDINIYPKNFDSKNSIKAYLDAYNIGKSTEDQVIYVDLADTITSMMSTLINTITYVLVGFAAISLLVSSIMIGIITYVSVIERTKEIGILRSIGARKKDISRLFNAETLIIGFTSGILGIVIARLLIIPLNWIIAKFAKIQNVANLPLLYALLLVLGSMTLTLIAGFIPARIAAKKDPVTALRIE